MRDMRTSLTCEIGVSSSSNMYGSACRYSNQFDPISLLSCTTFTSIGSQVRY